VLKFYLYLTSASTSTEIFFIQAECDNAMAAEGISGLKEFFFRSRKMKLFLVWFIGIVFLLFVWIGGESVNDRTVAVSAIVCGGSTFFFWSYRAKISNFFHFALSPRKKFVLIGSIGAAWAEFIFWFFEKVFGAFGVAASPNLVLDLIITMPWYIMMLFLLFKVETKYSYSFTEIVLFGGIYELGADGIFGQVFSGLTLPNLLLTILMLPLFVIVYSVIVLPPTYVLRREIEDIRTLWPEGTHKYWYGLYPLAGLIPYSVYAIVLLLFLSML
jgi:hypothetical protein